MFKSMLIGLLTLPADVLNGFRLMLLDSIFFHQIAKTHRRIIKSKAEFYFQQAIASVVYTNSGIDHQKFIQLIYGIQHIDANIKISQDYLTYIRTLIRWNPSNAGKLSHGENEALDTLKSDIVKNNAEKTRLFIELKDYLIKGYDLTPFYSICSTPEHFEDRNTLSGIIHNVVKLSGSVMVNQHYRETMAKTLVTDKYPLASPWRSKVLKLWHRITVPAYTPIYYGLSEAIVWIEESLRRVMKQPSPAHNVPIHPQSTQEP